MLKRTLRNVFTFEHDTQSLINNRKTQTKSERETEVFYGTYAHYNFIDENDK